MENVASSLVWKAIMSDRRVPGEWVLCAEVRGEEGIVANIEWRRTVEEQQSAESVSPSPLSFPNLTTYQDFRAFWTGCGGVIEEE